MLLLSSSRRCRRSTILFALLAQGISTLAVAASPGPLWECPSAHYCRAGRSAAFDRFENGRWLNSHWRRWGKLGGLNWSKFWWIIERNYKLSNSLGGLSGMESIPSKKRNQQKEFTLIFIQIPNRPNSWTAKCFWRRSDGPAIIPPAQFSAPPVVPIPLNWPPPLPPAFGPSFRRPPAPQWTPRQFPIPMGKLLLLLIQLNYINFEWIENPIMNIF